MPALDAYTDYNPLYQYVGSKPQYDGIADGNVSRKPRVELLGIDGYKNTLLDFDKYWSAIKDGTPILTTFVTDETVVDVEGIKR